MPRSSTQQRRKNAVPDSYKTKSFSTRSGRKKPAGNKLASIRGTAPHFLKNAVPFTIKPSVVFKAQRQMFLPEYFEPFTINKIFREVYQSYLTMCKYYKVPADKRYVNDPEADGADKIKPLLDAVNVVVSQYSELHGFNIDFNSEEYFLTVFKECDQEPWLMLPPLCILPMLENEDPLLFDLVLSIYQYFKGYHGFLDWKRNGLFGMVTDRAYELKELMKEARVKSYDDPKFARYIDKHGYNDEEVAEWIEIYKIFSIDAPASVWLKRITTNLKPKKQLEQIRLALEKITVSDSKKYKDWITATQLLLEHTNQDSIQSYVGYNPDHNEDSDPVEIETLMSFVWRPDDVASEDYEQVLNEVWGNNGVESFTVRNLFFANRKNIAKQKSDFPYKFTTAVNAVLELVYNKISKRK